MRQFCTISATQFFCYFPSAVRSDLSQLSVEGKCKCQYFTRDEAVHSASQGYELEQLLREGSKFNVIQS